MRRFGDQNYQVLVITNLLAVQVMCPSQVEQGEEEHPPPLIISHKSGNGSRITTGFVAIATMGHGGKGGR